MAIGSVIGNASTDAAASAFNTANGSLKALNGISFATDAFECVKGPSVASCAAAALSFAAWAIAPPGSLAGSVSMKAASDNRTVLSAVPGNVSTALDI